MKLRTIAVITLILAGAITISISPTAGGSGDVPDDDRKGSAPEIRTEEMIPTGLSWEGFLRDSSRQITAEELDRIAEKVKQNSSPAHYFPNSPDDARMEPPALDADGQEKP